MSIRFSSETKSMCRYVFAFGKENLFNKIEEKTWGETKQVAKKNTLSCG